jgi:hypothetical protein
MPLLLSAFLSYLTAIAIAGIFCWRDAKYRGKSQITVVALVVLTFPVGLIAWLLFRPDPPTRAPREKFEIENYRLQ